MGRRVRTARWIVAADVLVRTVVGFLAVGTIRDEDPCTGKWVRKSRYREWEIDGPAELRGDVPVRMFQPALPRLTDTPLELQPHLAISPRMDATEQFLLRLFLRRYVTWCARRGRFAAMNGAARLHREVCAS
jgi:hypothetical protein